MTTNAAILNNKIAVTYSHRPDVGREYLLIAVKGWDEVQKLVNKVLSYDGRDFTYTGWNSDNNQCFFARSLTAARSTTATITCNR